MVLFSCTIYNTKTTQVLDNVGQRVVEYGIFNDFAERVQNSIPDNEICDFGPFSETYFAEILGGTKKLTPPHDTLQTSSFQMV